MLGLNRLTQAGKRDQEVIDNYNIEDRAMLMTSWARGWIKSHLGIDNE